MHYIDGAYCLLPGRLLRELPKTHIGRSNPPIIFQKWSVGLEPHLKEHTFLSMYRAMVLENTQN
jgi:hypothetical protein